MNYRYPLTTELLTLFSLWLRVLRQDLHSHCSLSVAQFRLLGCLKTNNSPLHIHEIAERLGVGSSTVTYMVSRFEAQGLTIRSDDDSDQRAVQVQLTENGLALIMEAQNVAEGAIGKLMMPLGSFLQNTARETADHTIMAFGVNGGFLINETIFDAVFLAEKSLNEILKAEDLSFSEFRILFELSEHSDGCRPGQLSKDLLLKNTEVSLAAKNLSARSLIKRHRETFDRRTKTFELTTVGYPVISELAAAVDDMLMLSVPDGLKKVQDTYLKTAHLIVDAQRKNFKSK